MNRKSGALNVSQSSSVTCGIRVIALMRCVVSGGVAPRVNEFLIEARNRGATIILTPSPCVGLYKVHSVRNRVSNVPKVKNLPIDIEWCH